jgi:hippurate hydrolase
VSRELAASEAAVVTVGALQAGDKENVIPDEAVIRLNVRTFEEDVRTRALAAITRIVNAEAAASGAPKPPEITPLDRYSLVTNDPDATRRVVDAFRKHFGTERVREAKPTSASEDFCVFGTAWQTPSVFWFVGSTDPKRYADAKQAGRVREIPTHHNPEFAPALHPTLETGIAAMVITSYAWLTPSNDLEWGTQGIRGCTTTRTSTGSRLSGSRTRTYRRSSACPQKSCAETC